MNRRKKFLWVLPLVIILLAACKTGDKEQQGLESGPPEIATGGPTVTPLAEAPAEFTLNITLHGTGEGYVKSPDGGIFCGIESDGTPHNECLKTYQAGATVDLIATPTFVNGFDMWSGDPSCRGDVTCAVVMNDNKDIAAVFKVTADSPVGPRLEVTVHGAGVVQSNPLGIDCGIDQSGTRHVNCLKFYPAGSAVVLTAGQPVPGNTFGNWEDHTVTLVRTIALSGNITVEANFISLGSNLMIKLVNSDKGYVTDSSGIIFCGTNPTDGSYHDSCLAGYAMGNVVLLAQPSTPVFSKWDGVCFVDGSGSCTIATPNVLSITLNDADENVTAIFNP